MPNIMILSQAVLQIFCSEDCFTTQNDKVEKADNSVKYLPKVNQVSYTLDIICEPNITTLAQAVVKTFCSQGSIGLQWES